jgi:hypothetical protein
VEKSNLISTPFSRTKDVNPPQKHSPQKNKGPINIFLALLLMLFIITCVPQTTISPDVAADKEKAKQEVKQQKNPYANAEITIKTIPAANNTFGYDILLYGKPLVHQPNIPGLPGMEGFSAKERAQKVAEFVVQKIRRNEMPPTVTIEDLNRMGALKKE